MVIMILWDRNYMLLVEIKDFNALIDNKQLFDKLVENKQGTCEKPIEMSKTMIIQQENYYINRITKIMINSLAQIYQNKQIQAFFNKLISWEN